MDALRYQYNCIHCREEWENEVWLADYEQEDEPYFHNNICPLCNMDAKEVIQEMISVDHTTKEIISYFVRRYYNKIINSLMTKPVQK